MVIEAQHPPVEREWPPPQGQWTYEDYARLPDDGWRYEVIKGVLYMSPSPRERHQYALTRLVVAMTTFADAHELGRVYTAPFDVIMGDLATPVQPDLLFIAADRLSEILTEDNVQGAPDLIVEILSPSNWLVDRREKFEVYQEAGVREYWIVDTDQRLVEVFVLREGVFTQIGRWGGGEKVRSEVLTGFEIAVDEICPER